IDGKAETVNEILETIDAEKKLLKFNVVDGKMLKRYKIFEVTLQVFEKDADEAGSSSGLVKWTFDYEK
ncbi:Bet v I/Major latex protein, partial [Parasponia andersonii]